MNHTNVYFNESANSYHFHYVTLIFFLFVEETFAFTYFCSFVFLRFVSLVVSFDLSVHFSSSLFLFGHGRHNIFAQQKIKGRENYHLTFCWTGRILPAVVSPFFPCHTKYHRNRKSEHRFIHFFAVIEKAKMMIFFFFAPKDDKVYKKKERDSPEKENLVVLFF